MADKSRMPPTGIRALTQRDRDVRETKAPPSGLYERASDGAVAEQFADEPTNPHASDFEKMQQRAARAARNSKAALDELAEVRKEFRGDLISLGHRLDSVARESSDTRVAVAEMRGELKVLPELVGTLRDAVNRASDREHIALTDGVAAKRWTREQIGKVIAAAVGGGGVMAMIAALVQRCG